MHLYYILLRRLELNQRSSGYEPDEGPLLNPAIKNLLQPPEGKLNPTRATSPQPDSDHQAQIQY